MSSNKKIKEKHISVSEEMHSKLRLLAKKSGRTMRGMLNVLISQEEKKQDGMV